MSIKGQRMFYYWNLFPFEDCCRWFSYGNGYILSLREFAFGVEGNSFLRFLSFHNALDLKLSARRICPGRIDIGSVYTVAPALAVIGESEKSLNFNITQREMIFDIDISDYDDVRTCCKKAQICQKCWKYMALACKILDTSLREDFAFKNILWTYSGGRGIHCWVCDEAARKLQVQDRIAIVNYLQLVRPGAFNTKKVFLNKIHPSTKRALEIIEQDFVNICIEEQNILGTDEGVENFFNVFLQNENAKTKKDLQKIFKDIETSKGRWEALIIFLKKIREWEDNFLIEEIMLQYIYPRLDVNVTISLPHLLKCPFSPHDSTNKICLPFDPTKIDDFDPTTSPDYPTLFEEFHREQNELFENWE